MMIDTERIVSMTDANQNFSRVVRMVDENGIAVIMKNNRPRYAVIDFDEYEALDAAMQMRRQLLETAADRILDENIEAFMELAK